MTKNNYIKRALFRLRWLAMSDRERYAYLWRQTRESMYTSINFTQRYAYLWKQMEDTPYNGRRMRSVR
jgi:hypothetical protein